MHRLTHKEIAALKQKSSKGRAAAERNPYTMDMRVQGDASDKSGVTFETIKRAADAMNVYNELKNSSDHLDANYTQIMKCYNALCATAVPPGQEARVHSSIAGDELCKALIHTGTKIRKM